MNRLFDVDLMDKVGKNARHTVETYYSTAANSEKLSKVIEQLRVAVKPL